MRRYLQLNSLRREPTYKPDYNYIVKRILQRILISDGSATGSALTSLSGQYEVISLQNVPPSHRSGQEYLAQMLVDGTLTPIR